jgi:hypothetical protein
MRESEGKGVKDRRRSGSQCRVSGSAVSRKYERVNLQYGISIQMEILRRNDGFVALVLLGELDITTMAQFERVLGEVMSQKPKGLIFDVTQTRFISAQGYDAMGRCSLETHVEVRSGSDLAARVLASYGYEHSLVAPTQDPGLNALC